MTDIRVYFDVVDGPEAIVSVRSPMKTIELADAATASFSDVVGVALREPVVITLKGRPVVALTAIGTQTDLENLIVSSDPQFRALIERSRSRYPPGTGLSTDEVRQRLGLPAKRRRAPAATVRRRGARRQTAKR